MPSLNLKQINRLKKQAAIGSIVLAVTLIAIKSLGVFYSCSLSVFSSMVDSPAHKPLLDNGDKQSKTQRDNMPFGLMLSGTEMCFC